MDGVEVGLATTDHVDPFHDSMSVFWRPDSLS